VNHHHRLTCLFTPIGDNAEYGSPDFRTSVVSGVWICHHVALILIAALVVSFPEATVDKISVGAFVDPTLPESFKHCYISLVCIYFMTLYTRAVLQNALLEPDLSMWSFRLTVLCAEIINLSVIAVHTHRFELVIDFASPGSLYVFCCLMSTIVGCDLLLAGGKRRMDQFHGQILRDKYLAENELRLMQQLETQNRLRVAADIQARTALAQAKEADARTKAEQQLQAYLSHEVRNPLNVITHTLSFALNKLNAPDGMGQCNSGDVRPVGLKRGDNEGNSRDTSGENDTRQLREWCTNALSSAGYVLDLLNNLLDLSRLEDGNLQLCKAPVYLETLCQDIKKQLSSAVQPGVTLQVVVTPPGAVIVTDDLRLRQLLYNLLSNALKFTSTGWVRLAADYDRHQRVLSIEVADTGVGISAEEMPQLFEKYHQVFPLFPLLPLPPLLPSLPLPPLPPLFPPLPMHVLTPTDVFSSLALQVRHKQVAKQKQQTGTGLGLSIAQQIAVLMGSRIQVTSPHRQHLSGAVTAGRSSVSSNSGSSGASNGSGGSLGGSLFSLCIPHVDCASSSGSGTEKQVVSDKPDLATLSSEFGVSVLHGLQVLLVDDEPLNLMILRAILQQSTDTKHYEISCDTAPSGEEALSMAISAGDGGSGDDSDGSCPYDVIVLDQHLGNSGGRLLGTEVSAKLRKTWQTRRPPLRREPVLVICSGNCTQADAVRYRKSGADLVWPKPVPSAPHIVRDLALALRAREGGGVGGGGASREL
jgi:signal transduction histidine kinase/DNA-binding NarL/FixJ family response regulator